MADDGRHFLWSHECTLVRCTADGWDPDDPSTWDYWHGDVQLPLGPNGWTVESVDPLTISPSILCGSCGLHGLWRDGRWVPA